MSWRCIGATEPQSFAAKRVGRLHVLTEVQLQRRYSHQQLAALALAGGADVVQVRDKAPLSARRFVAEVAAIAGRCTAQRAHCIVDDRVDIAAAAMADGVHLGADDVDVETARRLLGATAIIGRTANSVDEARRLFAAPISYLGVGPVFGTTSKLHPAPPLGLEALSVIAAESPVPVIAIGRIAAADIPTVMATGCHGVAVLSGIALADDPQAATADYAAALRAFLASAGQQWNNVATE